MVISEKPRKTEEEILRIRVLVATYFVANSFSPLNVRLIVFQHNSFLLDLYFIDFNISIDQF